MVDEIIHREVNGIVVPQRQTDGYINGTAMCQAHGKLIADWLRLASTYELAKALADSLGIPPKIKDGESHNSTAAKASSVFPTLVVVKRGSPEAGGGTFLHPELAVQLAQWCSPEFALQVSRWVLEWMSQIRAAMQVQADVDRLEYRTELKDNARLRVTGQIKDYLERIKKYDDIKYRSQYYAQVHDALNVAITGETALQMRERLGVELGRKIKETELLRDYYPSMPLLRLIALCEATANIISTGKNPVVAVEEAKRFALPSGYVPKPIEFTAHIKLTRKRVEALTSSQAGLILPPGW